MVQPTLSRLTVLDLVPFGAPVTGSGFYALRLSLPKWEQWQPGQFVMLKTPDGRPDALWARPFSICLVTRRDLVLFFQVTGRMTASMSKLVQGSEVLVWGPLGNGMRMEKNRPTLLIAGGIGIAPFIGYAHSHPTPWELAMEFGHRLPLSNYPFDSINEKILVDPHHEKSLDDRCRFLSLLDRRIKEHAENGLVLACGPTGLLHSVQQSAARHKARAMLSLETRMACGVGACLGCVVKAWSSGIDPADQQECFEGSGGLGREPHYVQTCTCGPNFWADSVEF